MHVGNMHYRNSMHNDLCRLKLMSKEVDTKDVYCKFDSEALLSVNGYFSSRGGSYLLKYTPLDALCGVCVCELCVRVVCVCV